MVPSNHDWLKCDTCYRILPKEDALFLPRSDVSAPPKAKVTPLRPKVAPRASNRVAAQPTLGPNGQQSDDQPESYSNLDSEGDGFDTEEVEEDLNDLLPTRGAINIYSFAELFQTEDEDIDWIWDGILSSNCTSLLSAAPKAGKSAFLRTLAWHIAHGTPLLGRNVKKGLVFYMTLEDQRGRLKIILKPLFDMTPNPEETSIEWHVGPVFDEEGKMTALEQLEEYIKIQKPALVIVDTIIRFFAFEDTNAYSEVYPALNRLQEVSREYGAHICFAHHNSKSNSILGSTAFPAAVDTVMKITIKKNGSRTMSTEQRYGDALDETILYQEPSTGLITSDISKAGNGSSGTKSTPAATLNARLLKLMAMVRACQARGTPDCYPVPQNAIIKENGWSHGTLKGVYAEAYKQGLLIRTGTGLKGNPFLYSLTDGMPPATLAHGETLTGPLVGRVTATKETPK